MHKPTYFFLMAGSACFGVYNLYGLWHTNWLLLGISIAVTLATVIGMGLQSLNIDNFEFKWMVVYIAPLFVLALGAIAGAAEIQDENMRQLGLDALEHIIPGKRSDYETAFAGQIVAMLWPSFAALMAWLVQVGLDTFGDKSH